MIEGILFAPKEFKRTVKIIKSVLEKRTLLIKTEAAVSSTKNLIESFSSEFKDLILETVLKQIIENPDMKERFLWQIGKGG